METMYNYKGQPYIIRETYMKDGRKYACVEFLDTGTISHFRADITKKGRIKDRYAKDVMGLFCIGDAKKIDNKKEYNIWYHMLERCYDVRNKSYKDYGGKSVVVCERWHCFEYFLSDLPLIDGYDICKLRKGELQLDKDIKQKGKTSKIYSVDTCTFVTRDENMAERWERERLR